VYKEIFRRLHLEGGVSPDSNAIAFNRSGVGLSISGSTKGFMHFKHVPVDLQICRDLERAFEELGRPSNGSCYRHLEGAWYLYTDWT
jgi:hypothetical protein